MNNDLETRVKEVLDMFRPNLQADGGDMEFISIDEKNRVHLILTGACGGCPMAVMTQYLKSPKSCRIMHQKSNSNSLNADFLKTRHLIR